MKDYTDFRVCYPLRPKEEVDNIYLDLNLYEIDIWYEIWGAYQNKILKRGIAPQLKNTSYTSASDTWK